MVIPALAKRQASPKKLPSERAEERKEIIELRVRDVDDADDDKLQKSASDVSAFMEPLLAVFPDESV